MTEQEGGEDFGLMRIILIFVGSYTLYLDLLVFLYTLWSSARFNLSLSKV